MHKAGATEIIGNRYHLAISSMSEFSLSALEPGAVAIIKDIAADEALHHRLWAMGFRVGREVRMVRRAWFSGPLQLRVGTTDVIMRRTDAEKIRVSDTANP